MIRDATARRPLLDEPPAAPAVFADPSGRRRRLGRRLGSAAGALLVCYLGALGVSVATGADVPLTTWTGPPDHRRVDGTERTGPGTTPESARRRDGTPGVRGPGGGAGTPMTGPSQAGTGGSGAAPSGSPGTPRPPAATPTGDTSTYRPGNSHASPPQWGRKKKSR
ncbi:hypothetical protein [Actinomadura macra]|uniref:hypothetical protein n=1 Tax=Actinomadura macra TaxID=46164 RepID=UPI000AE42FF4|nr:hypothetical protein [Actinomadura macra]